MKQVFGQSDVDLLAFAGEQESQEIKSSIEFKDALAKFASTGNEPTGPMLPWMKTQHTIRLNPGQLTVWAGENGSGKSVLVGQVIYSLLRNQKAVIASLEMSPVETLYRMACQAADCKPAPDYCESFCLHHDQKLWIYDQQDSVEWSRILGLIYYSAKELGAHHIVLDSLTKCGLTRDDYAQQARFIDRLQWAAKNTGIHIHLVAHMRKGQEGHKQGKFDIRGAAEISDLADNVFVLSRNFAKEAEARKRREGMVADDDKLRQPCAFLQLEKNRHYGELANWGLWFDPKSLKYREAA
jgi:twinkle protein